jgi:hypothetical protein
MHQPGKQFATTDPSTPPTARLTDPGDSFRARNERAFTEIGQIFGKVGLKTVLAPRGVELKQAGLGVNIAAAANQPNCHPRESGDPRLSFIGRWQTRGWSAYADHDNEWKV